LRTVVAAIAISTLLLSPVFAGGGGNGQGQNGNGQGQNGNGNGMHGAPGPVIGAGLPILAVGFGVYWVVRRRRKADVAATD
jgi:hypothetical protein